MGSWILNLKVPLSVLVCAFVCLCKHGCECVREISSSQSECVGLLLTCSHFNLLTIYPQALRSEPLLIRIQSSSLKICCTLSRLLQSSSSASGLRGLQVFANFNVSSAYIIFMKSKEGGCFLNIQPISSGPHYLP